MTELGKLKRAVTADQKLAASNMAQALAARGFRPDHLEESLFRIAEAIGETNGRDDVERAKMVNAELSTADEINAMSMHDQLEILVAYHKTAPAFRAAIEKDLAISLDVAPLPLSPAMTASVETEEQAVTRQS